MGVGSSKLVHCKAVNFRAAILIVITAGLLMVACTDRAAKLEDYGAVPEFQMRDSTGRAFDSKELEGKAWVADFIYTNCPAECPMMSAKMHSVEKQIRGDENLRLISISVDPERDTPPVLERFATRYGAPTKQWRFLTGTPETVHRIAFTTFHVGDVINKINHSTKFVLVDKRGHIRGYYSSLGQDDMPRLLKDLSALGSEAS